MRMRAQWTLASHCAPCECSRAGKSECSEASEAAGRKNVRVTRLAGLFSRIIWVNEGDCSMHG